MRVFKARFGFATNSSSYHSIILDYAGRTRRPFHDLEIVPTYGWDWFVLNDRISKQVYFNTQLFSALLRFYKNEVELAKADYVELSGDPLVIEETSEVLRFDGRASGNRFRKTFCIRFPKVDHQSQWVFPLEWEGSSFDADFINDFRNRLFKTDVAIIGGNDNDSPPPYVQGERRIHIPINAISGDFVCRKDPEYGFWVLFSRKTGEKYHLQFKNDLFLEQPAPEFSRASLPELVDLKVTDFCAFNCPFCYQGSSKRGKHAPLERIKSILDSLCELKVFEVAIGGGEPSAHPDLQAILEYARSLQIVPNLTTHNIPWIRSGAGRSALRAAGGIAVSCNTKPQLEAWKDLVKTDPSLAGKLTPQHVVGSNSLEFLKELCSCTESGIITLLGYKNVGRGKDFEPINVEGVKEVLDSLYSFGVDTAMIQQFPEIFEELPRWMYHSTEGTFSMYIDAVDFKMGESSFVPSSEMVKFEITPNLGSLIRSYFCRKG